MTKTLSHLTAYASILLACAGCATVYGGANLTDDAIKTDVALSLGLTPADITIVTRQTEGPNTFVNVKTKNNRELVCRFIGGGWGTLGMRTAPSCNDKLTGKVESSGACNELLRAAGQCENPAPTQPAAAAPAAPSTAAQDSSTPRAVPATAPPSAPTPVAAAPAAVPPPAVAPVPLDRNRIAKAQAKLRTLGFDPGPADGAAGAKTVQAVRQFQRSKSLKVTGELDAETMRALGL
jgi:Putative peptidoglycan binding domain